MTKFSKKNLILGLSFALMASACTNLSETYKKAADLPKATAEQESSANHVVSFSNGTSLSEEEKMGIDTFVYENGIGYGDELILEFATGDQGWSSKMDAITGHLKTRGIWVDYAGPSDNISNSSVARLVLNRYRAYAPDCFALSQQTFYPGELENSKTLGCITAHNLAAMVAKPQDLIKGTPDALPDTYAAVRAIQLYRGRRGRDYLAGPLPVTFVIVEEVTEEEK